MDEGHAAQGLGPWNANPMEAHVYGTYGGDEGILATLGLGTGIIAGVGAPDFRLVLGVNYRQPGGPPDSDLDGLTDDIDACPMEAEDKDNFEDTDGCPDKDNDRDGILDATDKCPDQAEIINSVDDSDGCPDEGKVKLTEAKIEILEKVFFKTGKDAIDAKSFALLDQVSAVLVATPRIKKVRVEGHTDNVGKAKKNTKLSQQRADAVKKYLVSKGVEDARLEAVGFGPDKPIADNATDEGKEANRRVEFVIVE